MIIGLVGFINSGKNTVGRYLVESQSYSTTSFAKSLKDCVASMFCWPRDLLEGDTAEGREWREQVDPWWSKKLGRPVTPRWVLQYFGTDIVRMHFNTNMWIWSLERQIMEQGSQVVITDARFPNEVKMLRDMGGKIIWVRKKELPEWYEPALAQNRGQGMEMTRNYSGVHPSEWAWIGCDVDATIVNEGTVAQLHKKVDQCLKSLT